MPCFKIEYTFVSNKSQQQQQLPRSQQGAELRSCPGPWTRAGWSHLRVRRLWEIATICFIFHVAAAAAAASAAAV